MADVKHCPKCRLVNSASAQRCDCGYDFVSGTVESSYADESAGATGGGGRLVGFGCLVLALLLLLSGVTVATKAAGGAGAGDAGAMGEVCGAFVPGVVALGVAAYLLRRPR
jgi:hypothetical protein